VTPFFDSFKPLEPHRNNNYIAFVIIALDHHAQFNKSICDIFVYISTCAFPTLLGYSLWLYYLALHCLLTRGCDHLIGRCRDRGKARPLAFLMVVLVAIIAAVVIAVVVAVVVAVVAAVVVAVMAAVMVAVVAAVVVTITGASVGV
jgi:hypothetical protein